MLSIGVSISYLKGGASLQQRRRAPSHRRDRRRERSRFQSLSFLVESSFTGTPDIDAFFLSLSRGIFIFDTGSFGRVKGGPEKSLISSGQPVVSAGRPFGCSPQSTSGKKAGLWLKTKDVMGHECWMICQEWCFYLPDVF